jgi:hypothetical protein
MKKYLNLLLVSVILASCSEEVSKDINTDLTQEAGQFFSFSETINESAYLGNISYPEFSQLTSAELPGCPAIILNPDSRIITLDYSLDEECEQQDTIPKTGRIVLDFTRSNSESPSWSLAYEDYTYRGIKIEGMRMFEGISLTENQESFENLTVELDGMLSFRVDGELSYTVSRTDTISQTDTVLQVSLKPLSLKTRGKIEGTNPAGRDFLLLVTTPKEQLFECYSTGWDLPKAGKESWIVSRNATADLEYDVNFQSTEICNPVVVSTLPDGRTLQLNP